jgi:hypothetical protein
MVFMIEIRLARDGKQEILPGADGAGDNVTGA